jgi:hypothetical protein
LRLNSDFPISPWPMARAMDYVSTMSRGLTVTGAGNFWICVCPTRSLLSVQALLTVCISSLAYRYFHFWISFACNVHRQMFAKSLFLVCIFVLRISLYRLDQRETTNLRKYLLWSFIGSFPISGMVRKILIVFISFLEYQCFIRWYFAVSLQAEG